MVKLNNKASARANKHLNNFPAISSPPSFIHSFAVQFYSDNSFKIFLALIHSNAFYSAHPILVRFSSF